jgi:hypothetical protein
MLQNVCYRMLQNVCYRMLQNVCYRMLQNVCYRMLQNVCYRMLQNVCYRMLQSVCYRMLQNVCYRMLQNVCYRMLQNVCYRMLQTATECLRVIPSLHPPLVPYFKSALSTTTLPVIVPVFRSVSQPGRIPYSWQFAVHRSALRPTVRSEGLPVTSDDPRISKILEAETDRQTDRPVVIAIQNECKCILYSNADVGYKDIIFSAIEVMFSARSWLSGHEGPEGQ